MVSTGRLPFLVPLSLPLKRGAKAGMQAPSRPQAFSAKCQKRTPAEYQVRSPNQRNGLLEAKSTTVLRVSFVVVWKEGLGGVKWYIPQV